MKKSSPARILGNTWMVIAVVVIVAIIISINWYFYRRMKERLDVEFSTRLESLASLVSALVDPADLASAGSGFPSLDVERDMISAFNSLAEDHELTNIAVLREDGIVVLSLHPDLIMPGDIYPLWNQDYPSIVRALDGVPSSTGLVHYESDQYFKAGYAPIPPYSGRSGFAAAVEANVGFLESLKDLRGILVVSTIISIAGLAIFIWFVVMAAGSLIRARESLIRSESLASMGRMAAGIAHEIRNPLFIIRSGAEKLRDSHPEDAAHINEFIIDEADRLNGILTDYLLLARNERTSLQKSDLVTIVRRSIRLVSESGKGPQRGIETAFGVMEAPLICEEKKLQQVFLNILLNAIQSGDGAEVKVSLSRAGNGYIVSFSDNGEGIDARDIERIFEPFYSTRNEGSGLGLAIARNIVEDHGGTIRARSVKGEGTVMEIFLPYGKETSGEAND